MSTENIVLMLLFPPPQAVDSSLPVANQGHIQISGTREFDSLFGNLATGERTRRVQIKLIYLFSIFDNDVPPAFNSIFGNFSTGSKTFRSTISTGTFCFPQKTHKKKQKLINRNRNTQKTGNRMQSFGEVHLELKSCPVLDQQHPILSIDSLSSVHCTQIYKL